MASQPESKIPGPGGGGGGGRGEKRRSFLPAPKRSSAIPGPASSAAPAAAASLRSPAAAHKEWAREEEAEVVPGAERLTVGGRILISGVKPGILRFVGKTHIAPGFWCGIELFDASGLHDGEVDGKRYFTCKPFRGIFAPLDKVLPDESHPSPTVDEKRSTISEKLPERDHAEKQGLEPARKAADYESSKIPAPGKSQTVRQSGIPRIGSGGQDKGVARSASSGAVKENASKIATLSKRSTTTEDATAGSNVSLNSTFVLDGKQTNRSQLLSEDSDGDDSSDQTYSCRIEKRLQSDSRQYFNITFNKDNPPSSIPTSNLPDVVSSASPSPPRETAARAIPGTLKSAQDTTSSIASDISLGLMDPDIIADETNLLEGIISGKVASSASESDISQSGNSSTLEDTSVATVNEAGERGLTSTPLQGVHFKQFLEENGESLPDHLSDAEGVKAVGAKSAPSVKQGLSQTFAAVARDESARRKDSTSSTNGVAPRVDLLQEEGSNGVSPEVSQVLEWDYDHDAFDGKLLEKCQDGMSTSTSDSCSDASADPGLAEKGVSDVEMSAPDGEEANQFEENEDGFENIDSIEDFTLGMSKDTKHMMTDSGISEKGFLEPASDVSSNRKSVEFDSRVSVVGPPVEACVGADRGVTVDAGLQKDLMDGHKKQERPLSLVSTTSADTGYVPDTDSEAGTLTTNSPTDWTEKQLHANCASTNADWRQKSAASVKSKQSLIGRGVPGETVKEKESDSDVHRDATMVDNTQTEGPADGGDLDRTACHDESEESEDGEEEEESDSSEVETSEEEEEEDEEEEEEEDEEGADDRPEDDRIEADRVAPSGAANAVGVGSAGPALASGLQDGVGSEMTESAGPSVADLTGSSVGSEMTESADPACGVTRPSAEQQGGGGLREVTPAKSEGERSSNAADESGNTSAVDAKAAPADGEGDRLNRSSQAQKKRKSSASTSASRKAAAEHKKAVKAVSSRLADYIKAPLPPAKPKEEKKAEHASQKNQAGKTNKAAGKKRDNGSGADKPKGDGKEETKREKRPTPVKEEKPKVKRTAPKSKWGNIMSQIEANKDTVKIKPKAEIKSSLAVYLSTPVTASNTPSKKENEEEKEPNKQKDEAAPKSKLVKLVKHPKPDFSNIKSKLNITSPPKLPKARERSASPNSGNPNDSEKPANRKESRTSLPKKPAMPWLKKKVLVDHHVTPDNCSTASQGSCADLSGVDGVDGSSPAQENKGNTVSCSNPRLKNERASSVGSSKSDMSNAQRSTKTMNLRNAQKSEAQSTNSPRGKKSTVKSSIPPPTPRRASNTTARPVSQKAAGESAPPARLRSSPPKEPAAKAGAANARSRATAVVANQGRNRGKAGSGLKSGHPPDVVSTSARGSRAQEVARLESLCEARTKELNVAKMQLKAGLQAFDAVTCLLNYCTNQLDAFSCPAVTASLHTAEAKLLEQQQQLECLGQQKIQLEQQLQELTAARDAALHDVTRLQQEMTQAEETHSAAQQRLQEEHAAALNDQQEQLTSQHQQTVQQLQSYSEKQADYTHQSHKRQLAELAAEHQMATNQLKVAHLEEIQELRNKHDLQMEELHAQHRNKLEDITRRFESIKLSLSEKVQSLCVECDELRFRAKTSEDALQRDADVKVQMALAPYLNLPQEIESLRTVIDMRTEEIQKLRRQNMDLEKQLEELPIAQEKVVSLQQKVENLQAIINIKTDHEKQLHEKCQVLMRKYDRESRANKRLSMDYEQVVWRMSQSADFSDSVDSLTARQLSHSPTSGDQQQQQQQQHSRTSPSPVRRTHSSTPGADNANGSTGVTRRQRRISAGDEDYDRRIRCRSATFSLDKSRGQHAPTKGEGATGVNGTGSSGRAPSKLPVMAKSGDYTALIVAAMDTGHDESFSSGHESGDTSDFQSSMESSVILETAQGLSYNITVADSVNGVAEPDREASTKLDDVFVEEACVQSDTAGVPADAGVQSGDVAGRTDVTVVVVAPSSE